MPSTSSARDEKVSPAGGGRRCPRLRPQCGCGACFCRPAHGICGGRRTAIETQRCQPVCGSVRRTDSSRRTTDIKGRTSQRIFRRVGIVSHASAGKEKNMRHLRPLRSVGEIFSIIQVPRPPDLGIGIVFRSSGRRYSSLCDILSPHPFLTSITAPAVANQSWILITMRRLSQTRSTASLVSARPPPLTACADH
jgi:hypothetical protein